MAVPRDIVPPDFRTLTQRGAQRGLLLIRVIEALQIRATQFCDNFGHRVLCLRVEELLSAMPDEWIRELNEITVGQHQKLVEHFLDHTGTINDLVEKFRSLDDMPDEVQAESDEAEELGELQRLDERELLDEKAEPAHVGPSEVRADALSSPALEQQGICLETLHIKVFGTLLVHGWWGSQGISREDLSERIKSVITSLTDSCIVALNSLYRQGDYRTLAQLFMDLMQARPASG